MNLIILIVAAFGAQTKTPSDCLKLPAEQRMVCDREIRAGRAFEMPDFPKAVEPEDKYIEPAPIAPVAKQEPQTSPQERQAAAAERSAAAAERTASATEMIANITLFSVIISVVSAIIIVVVS